MPDPQPSSFGNICHGIPLRNTKRNSERLGNLEQIQVGRIPSVDFQAADVGTVEPALTRQVLLRPVLGRPELANAPTQPLKGGVRD